MEVIQYNPELEKINGLALFDVIVGTGSQDNQAVIDLVRIMNNEDDEKLLSACNGILSQSDSVLTQIAFLMAVSFGDPETQIDSLNTFIENHSDESTNPVIQYYAKLKLAQNHGEIGGAEEDAEHVNKALEIIKSVVDNDTQEILKNHKNLGGAFYATYIGTVSAESEEVSVSEENRIAQYDNLNEDIDGLIEMLSTQPNLMAIRTASEVANFQINQIRDAENADEKAIHTAKAEKLIAYVREVCGVELKKDPNDRLIKALDLIIDHREIELTLRSEGMSLTDLYDAEMKIINRMLTGKQHEYRIYKLSSSDDSKPAEIKVSMEEVGNASEDDKVEAKTKAEELAGAPVEFDHVLVDRDYGITYDTNAIASVFYDTANFMKEMAEEDEGIVDLVKTKVSELQTIWNKIDGLDDGLKGYFNAFFDGIIAGKSEENAELTEEDV